MAPKKKSKVFSRSDRLLQIGMASLGALLLLGTLGLVLNSAFRPQRPAVVEVVERSRTVHAGRTVVQVDAVNHGDVAAAAVNLTGTGPDNQSATMTIDYVPGHSRKAAAMTFQGNIGSAPLTLAATGWVDP